jgi:hypothetical protein
MVPSFDRVTVDEAIDIRAALEAPVVRFRKAVYGFERELVEVPALSGQLDDEIIDLWHGTVAPELVDLQDEIRSNSSLRVLAGGGVERLQDLAKGLLPGAIALSVGTFTGFQPALLAGLGLLGPALARQRDRKRALERNRMYLLHAVSEAGRP